MKKSDKVGQNRFFGRGTGNLWNFFAKIDFAHKGWGKCTQWSQVEVIWWQCGDTGTKNKLTGSSIEVYSIGKTVKIYVLDDVMCDYCVIIYDRYAKFRFSEVHRGILGGYNIK